MEMRNKSLSLRLRSRSVTTPDEPSPQPFLPTIEEDATAKDVKKFLSKSKSKAPARKWCFRKADDVQLFLIICGVVVGIALGFGLRAAKAKYSAREVSYISFLGDIFLRILKMLILPLVISSLINALTRLELRSIGKMAYITLVYILATTLIAVFEGIVLVVSIQPGRQNASLTAEEEGNIGGCKTAPLDSILDLFRNMFPDNILEATFRSTKTCITDIVSVEKVPVSNVTATANSNNTFMTINNVVEVVETTSQSGMNVLGLVTISVAFAVVINLLGKEGKPLKDLFQCIELATMKLVSAAIWLCPIGIVFLIAGQIVKMKDVESEFSKMGLLVLTALTAFFMHGVVVLPLIYAVIVRKNPLRYAANCIQPIITAAGTSSSSAALPVTIDCMEQKCGIDKRVAQFVCPLGATINMNGSALYEAVACIYIAQVIGRTLSIGEVIVVSLSATVTGIGAAGIPSAGPVTTLIVLTAVGLPLEYAAMIAPIDWFIDRIRTAVNVFGDCIGAAVVQKLCARDLPGGVVAEREMMSADDVFCPKDESDRHG